MEKMLVTWQEIEHHHAEQGSDWFWALGVIAVSSALTAVLFSNFLFAILILVAAATMVIVAKRAPKLVTFSITDRGVRIDDELYPYDHVLAFWVGEGENGEPTLFLDTTRMTNPDLIIPLSPDVDMDEVRTFLLERKIEEREMREPLSHRILEFFGF